MNIIEQLRQDPIAQLRSKLLSAYMRDRSFDTKARDDFFAALQKETADAQTLNELNAIQKEELTALTIVPRLNDPLIELAWAAQLTHSALDPRKREGFTSSTLWRAFAAQPTLNAQMVQYALDLHHDVPDATRISWGKPGSWFYFDPQNRQVNIDLLLGMMIGLTHTRAIVRHEISHAEITLTWTPAMRAIREEMVAIEQRMQEVNASGKEASQDDLHRLNRLGIEFQIRAQFFNAAEDNAVNRLTQHIGTRSYYDLGHSLNYLQALLVMAGISAGTDLEHHSGKSQPVAKETAKAKEAGDSFNALCGAINMSFFANNGLFMPMPEGWRSVNIDAARIPIAKSLPEFSEKIGGFINRIDGPQGFSRMQLRLLSLLRRLLPSNTQKNLAEKRFREIDQLWDDYAKPVADELIKQQEAALKEALKQMQKQAKEGQSQNKKGQNQGQNQRQNQTQGQSTDGKGKENSPSDSDKGRENQNTSQPKTGSGQEKEKKETPSSGDKTPAGASGQMPPKADVKEYGEVDLLPIPGETPEKERARQRGEKEKDKDANKPAEALAEEDFKGKTLREILDEANTAEQDVASHYQQQSKDMLRHAENVRRGKLAPAIDDLPDGDWKNYEQRIALLAPYIANVAEKLKAIKEAQLERREQPAKQHEFLPEDGDFSRFDFDSEMDRQIKMRSGQRLDENDFRRFHAETIHEQASTPVIYILIDGSGSMTNTASNGRALVDMALDASVILYEACKQMGVPCFIAMWGPSNPRILAKPGDEPVAVGKNIEKFRNGMNSSTYLSPALSLFSKSLAELPIDTEYSGYIHAMIYSDGDIFDAPACKKILAALFKHCPDLTVDVGLLVNNLQNSMAQMMQALAKQVPAGAVQIHKGLSPEALATNYIETLAERLSASDSLSAIRREDVMLRYRDAHEHISNMTL